jgi:peptidoglycan/LPS O-acetylase OafA/YrhL
MKTGMPMKETYRALNGLRFFAAIAVVFFHYMPEVTGFEHLPKVLRNLVQCGPIALGFFFILSGFVLASSYRDRALDSSGARRAFWLARFARLYPIYLVAYIFFAPIALQKYVLHPTLLSHAAGVETFFSAGFLSLLMIQAWTHLSQAWNGPSWSLSVEAFFYVIFPFVAARLMRMRTLFAGMLCVALWLTLVSIAIANGRGVIPHAIYNAYFGNSPLLWTPAFFIGITLFRFAAPWQKVNRLRADGAALLATAAILLICAFFPGDSKEVLISGALFPFLALAILAYSHQSSWFSRIMGATPLFRLGEVSYITYIMQAPLWHYFHFATNGLAHRSPTAKEASAWQFWSFLPFLILASFALSVFVERPVRAWILSGRRKPETSLSAPNVEILQEIG